MPDIYVQRPVKVEAAQFQGWATKRGLEALMKWLNEYEPFYVPEGYDHALRTESERDRSRGDILAGAYAFLILTIGGQRVRVNTNTWIVKDKNKLLVLINAQEFKKLYDEYIQAEDERG